jgi:DNA-binding transcriptional regulator GbsR (MarR family)
MSVHGSKDDIFVAGDCFFQKFCQNLNVRLLRNIDCR